jgi:two-component sensor histidine kinase
MHNYAAFTIQKKTGLIFSIFSFITCILNFISGLVNFGNTPFEAFTHYTVLLTLTCSLVLFITAFGKSTIFRYSQVLVILLAGLILVLKNERGDLTSTLILLFGMALAYQYGFFAAWLYIKMFIILGVYSLTTFANVFLINKLKLPSGIPSVLFSLTTIYLFWMVFQQEIKQYLIQTNQLSNKLGKVESDNLRLNSITRNQAVLIEKKNKILEENLKEKTEIEKELRNTLKVKDVLLQEVHHRVKNNLTVINSLLRMQHSYDNSDHINDFIEKNSNRLYAMAAVHEIIHQNEVYGSVNLTDYFTDITRNLVEIYSGNDDIKMDIQAENVEVTIDIAVSLGIILNDCVANSITFGLNNNTADRIILINIRKLEKIEITISDNGRQFPIDVQNANKDTSFSLWLIKVLVEDQLQGSIDTAYDSGNIWNIRIPYKDSDFIDS